MQDEVSKLPPPIQLPTGMRWGGGGTWDQPAPFPYSHLPTPHLIAWLHRQELPAPKGLPWGSYRASSVQQRGGTRQCQGEQEHRIDGGRHWTQGRREAKVRYRVEVDSLELESWPCRLVAV